MTATEQSAPADQAAARQAIAELKARYFRLMDTKDWKAMREVFAPEAVIDMREERQRLIDAGWAALEDNGPRDVPRSRDDIIADYERSVQGLLTVHHGHMGEIEFQSPSDATGIWAMEDIVRQADGANIREMHGYGHYHERYILDEEGKWRIAALRVTRLFVTLSTQIAASLHTG
ncbi:MAG: nuclear transport factor 2 family protein [Acidimicrobiia bacterium]|jgi:SnoaL-like domain